MPCPVCENLTYFFLKKDGYNFRRCPACGLVFVYPRPSEENLRKEVYSKKAGYQRNKNTDLKTARESPHIRKILDYLQKNNLNGSLLDVGCSNGEFLHHAAKRGFDVYGVELNKMTADIAKANGLNVTQGTLIDAKYPALFFDVVFLGDIIEHVPKPRTLILECQRILKPTGTLVVSTPNLDSFWAQATFKMYKWFTIPWSVLTPPHHLFQFSKANLKQFLRRYGFSLITAWFRRPPSLRYELGSLHLFGKWKREKSAKNFLFMCFAFAVYAKLYFLDMTLTPFKKKDFGMILVFIKTMK